jgi:hypothetical protein
MATEINIDRLQHNLFTPICAQSKHNRVGAFSDCKTEPVMKVNVRCSQLASTSADTENYYAYNKRIDPLITDFTYSTFQIQPSKCGGTEEWSGLGIAPQELSNTSGEKFMSANQKLKNAGLTIKWAKYLPPFIDYSLAPRILYITRDYLQKGEPCVPLFLNKHEIGKKTLYTYTSIFSKPLTNNYISPAIICYFVVANIALKYDFYTNRWVNKNGHYVLIPTYTNAPLQMNAPSQALRSGAKNDVRTDPSINPTPPGSQFLHFFIRNYPQDNQTWRLVTQLFTSRYVCLTLTILAEMQKQLPFLSGDDFTRMLTTKSLNKECCNFAKCLSGYPADYSNNYNSTRETTFSTCGQAHYNRPLPLADLLELITPSKTPTIPSIYDNEKLWYVHALYLYHNDLNDTYTYTKLYSGARPMEKALYNLQYDPKAKREITIVPKLRPQAIKERFTNSLKSNLRGNIQWLFTLTHYTNNANQNCVNKPYTTCFGVDSTWTEMIMPYTMGIHLKTRYPAFQISTNAAYDDNTWVPSVRLPRGHESDGQDRRLSLRCANYRKLPRKMLYHLKILDKYVDRFHLKPYVTNVYFKHHTFDLIHRKFFDLNYSQLNLVITRNGCALYKHAQIQHFTCHARNFSCQTCKEYITRWLLKDITQNLEKNFETLIPDTMLHAYAVHSDKPKMPCHVLLFFILFQGVRRKIKMQNETLLSDKPRIKTHVYCFMWYCFLHILPTGARRKIKDYNIFSDLYLLGPIPVHIFLGLVLLINDSTSLSFCTSNSRNSFHFWRTADTPIFNVKGRNIFKSSIAIPKICLGVNATSTIYYGNNIFKSTIDIQNICLGVNATSTVYYYFELRVQNPRVLVDQYYVHHLLQLYLKL